ncbi:MAG: hypothetical protein CM15mV42_1100 [uncultured marine virus]|nr:MAG: hypothetical protein CM15mV42_1100 [uncultured marine virus]
MILIKFYIQSKDFYVDEFGEFKEYGKATTENGQYKDYIRAMNAEVKQPGSSLNQALAKRANSGGVRSFTDAETLALEDAGFDTNTWKALSATGLPITLRSINNIRKITMEQSLILKQ